MEQLRDALIAADLNPVALGDKVLVLPLGARTIGLFADPARNAFWTDARLEDAEATRRLIEESGWLNLGGDRTWISPEVETHVADVNRFFDTYEVPGAVDPGTYEVMERDDRSVTLRNRPTIRFHRAGVDVPLSVTKRITMIDEPPVQIGPGVRCAGYRQSTRLQADGSLPETVRPAIWNLIQVPADGTITALLEEPAAPRPFFGTPEVSVTDRSVSCRVRTNDMYKFGVHADVSAGVLMCHHERDGRAELIVRDFEVRSADLYYDVPPDGLDERGYMTQVFVDDGTFGGFGELEYHGTALGTPGQDRRVDDVSRVWALDGPSEQIARVRDQLTEGR